MSPTDRYIIVRKQSDGSEKRVCGAMTFDMVDGDKVARELEQENLKAGVHYELRPYRPDVVEATAQIREAVAAGRITIRPEIAEAVGRMKLDGSGDRTITDIRLNFWGPNDSNGGGLGIDWQTQSIGAGRCDFYLEGGELKCDAQAMNKEFIMSLLQRMLEQTQIVN